MMPDKRLLECAVAFRMTTSGTGDPLSLGNGCPYVRMDTSGAPPPSGDAVLRLATGANAEDVSAAVSAHLNKGGCVPSAIVIEGEAVLTRADTPQALAGSPMTSTDPIRDRRLGGCIAIVTGSAQGFGKGIAAALARKGAAVVIADLNEELGMGTADELNAQYGPGTAIFATMNVTDAASIQAAVAACVAAFGGIDMFISNAGVLKAGGLDELDEAAFDLVTNVNYKGYFLGAQAVTPWMKRQCELNPGHFMDIIQINSKSGLQGSKRNFAYAGSKFGSIGLTQSFAMELVEHNIRVNSICPGNFFDGPLWSDPTRGLFVQYLQAGKVPGAKTLDDVKQFYMSKIPMGRGCTPDDVATAIFYVFEQKYETGQAIPVTGGQVMLN